jgi:hypothetical protein
VAPGLESLDDADLIGGKILLAFERAEEMAALDHADTEGIRQRGELRVRAYCRHKRETVGNEVYELTNNHFTGGYAEYGYTHWEALLTKRGKIVLSVNA